MGLQTVTPDIFFGGRCEEGIAFSTSATCARQEFCMRFEKNLMHASLSVGAPVLMASDGRGAAAKFERFSVALTLPTPAEARRAFEALADSEPMPVA